MAPENSDMTPESLGQMLEDFLGGSRHAVVLEDGAIVFDLLESKYSISGEYNKCVLRLWSAERNSVRRVVDAEVRNGNLRLLVQKLGQARPSKLEICRGRDQRTPTARRTARAAYQAHLRRALERHFPDLTVAKLSNAVDLEKSFGPIYTRGVLRRGHSAFAVLGVNQYETQASIDAALTFGILWLDACRHQLDQRMVVEGFKLFLPPGTSALPRERLVHLHSGAAKWHLYEYDERDDSIAERSIFRIAEMLRRTWSVVRMRRPHWNASKNRFTTYLVYFPRLKSRFCRLLKSHSAGGAWNSLVPELLTSHLLSRADKRSCSGSARRSVRSIPRIRRHFSAWSAVCAPRVLPMARGINLSGVFTPNGGSSLWSCVMSA
jgi:hypothetical protein